MSVEVKFCGLTTPEAIDAAVESGADYIGFVFYDISLRNVTPEKAAKLAERVPAGIATVAVTVDADDNKITEILSRFRPDYIQLHGNESPEQAKRIKAWSGCGIIKAFKVSNADDIAASGQFSDAADMFLFDARAPRGGGYLPGGNGISFDWALLQDREFSRPWFLSGGLNLENVVDAIRISGAKQVDVSSSLEIEPGVKSPELIREFMLRIRLATR